VLLRTILTRVIEQIDNRVSSSFNTAIEIKALEAINRRYKELNYLTGNRRGLPWMSKRYTFLTTAPYNTGTVTATNASRTIAGSGTTFTSAMVGRKFKLASDQSIYIITRFVSTTSIQIDRAFQGTTAGTLNYDIFEDQYDMPADFHADIIMSNPNSSGGLEKEGVWDLTNEFPNNSSFGTPQRYTIESFKSREGAVTTLTGTITFNDASRSVTGSGSSFTTELVPGDMIRHVVTFVSGTEAGTLWREVDSIASDTALTLKQAWNGTTGTSTTSQRQDGWLRVRLHPIPDDEILHTLKYIRQLPDLADMTNIPEMPDLYHPAIIDGALIDMYADQSDRQRVIARADFERWKEQLRKDYSLGTQTVRLIPALTNPRVGV